MNRVAVLFVVALGEAASLQLGGPPFPAAVRSGPIHCAHEAGQEFEVCQG